jgi:SAM-dependent methyltransferase
MDSGKGNNNGLEYTGERMIPGKADEENYFEHLARYMFAKPLVKGSRTLDAGCGEGYGSAILAQSASEVLSIDISPDTIESASGKYIAPNLKYIVMDVENINIDPGTFDAVVCFEVFEHIKHPENMLFGIKNILKAGGVLIISTPNGALPKSGKPNPFHVKEYTLQEFSEILTIHFPESPYVYGRYGQFNLRRRSGVAAQAMQGWMKLKRKFGIGKIMPGSVNKRLKDTKTGPYSVDDFAFREQNIEEAEYFVFVIRGKR